MRVRRPVPEYAQYEKLILKWAYYFARKCPVAVEDLVAEGHIAFCEALGTWDPAKGMFSTHLVWQIRNRMGGWVAREQRFAKTVRAVAQESGAVYQGEDELLDIPDAEPHFLQRLEEYLTDEGKRLVNCALTGTKFPTKQRKGVAEVKHALRTLRYT